MVYSHDSLFYSPPSPFVLIDTILDEHKRNELFTDNFCKVCGAMLQFESQRISHYEGKKHAQKVRLYFQIHGEQSEAQGTDKRGKLDFLTLQTDGSGVVDKNKFCDLCNMIFSSPVVAQSHYLGKVHAKKLKQLMGEHAQTSPPSSQPDKAGLPVASCAGPEPQQPTSDRAAPEAAMEETPPAGAGPTLDLNNPDRYCELCCAFFNSPFMAQQHYVGKKHKRSETRKKILEEIGQKTLPAESTSSALGVGNYICPICSITLTSIEMYQSHMQGNKHQIKESLVVNLMKNSKRTFHSFQDELADYIQVQKARGLEPKTYFRKMAEDHFEMDKYKEDQDARPQGTLVAFEQRLPPETFQACPGTYALTRTVENTLSHWSPVHDSRLRLESFGQGQPSKEEFSEKFTALGPTQQDDNSGPSSISSDNSINSYQAGHKPKGTHRRKRHLREDGEDRPNEEEKRKKNVEDKDSGKDHKAVRRRKAEADGTSVGKPKHRKEKRNREIATDKEDRRHRKEKKEPLPRRTEEEMLWDESILGF
ncbi:lysine-rich coiled-coil protein 1 isoform X1 [Sarcophilus harrisii]|uniref:lysine-rich coiled-coil protein 1 isoform X1 n=1 Tax=Sarcophilus harrisii TaxID=9305 RepID=UPI000C79B41B|nr:lysine-rich coiled-coil protein 1 isoform X1 [Sarcophilus harrisii]